MDQQIKKVAVPCVVTVKNGSVIIINDVKIVTDLRVYEISSKVVILNVEHYEVIRSVKIVYVIEDLVEL